MDQQHTVDAHAATPPAPAVEFSFEVVPRGSLWNGKLTENSGKQVKIVDATDQNKIRVEDTKSGRIGTLTLKTLQYRYQAADESIATPPTPPPQAEPDDSDAPTVPCGVNLAVVDGVAMYTHPDDEELITVRDVDLGARFGLSRPRDIRQSIERAIEDGAIDLCENSAPTDRAVLGIPLALKIKAIYTRGNGTKGETFEYHLNELAILVIAMRLRTDAAVKMQRAIAQAIAHLRQGRASEAARAVGAQPAQPSGLPPLLQAQLATIERLLAEGAIDSKTAAVRQALAVGQATGVDFLAPINVTFGRWSPVADAVSDLAPGQSVVITKPVDTSGHYSASQIAAQISPALSSTSVGIMARAMGLFRNSAYGVETSISDNGHELNRAWKYNEAARALLTPALIELTERFESKAKKDTLESMCAEIAAKRRNSPAAE